MPQAMRDKELESLIEAFLMGEVSRETILQELGRDRLAEIEHQRDAMQRDVEWGMSLRVSEEPGGRSDS